MAKKFELSVEFDSVQISDAEIFTCCDRDRLDGSGTVLFNMRRDMQFHYWSWDRIKEAETKLHRAFGDRVNVSIREVKR